MKELWEVATQAHNLPLTCVVGLFMLYWLICILGVVGIDAIDIDLDVDADADIDGVDASSVGPLGSFLRFVNAADVPLMAVLSLLSIFMWVGSMVGNYYLNPELRDLIILAIFGVSFIGSVILTKLATAPMVPLFKKMNKLEKAEPAVGGIGVVISKQVDEKYGQVEQVRRDGAPAILNCRTTERAPILRGTEVAIVSYDKGTGIYLVRTL